VSRRDLGEGHAGDIAEPSDLTRVLVRPGHDGAVMCGLGIHGTFPFSDVSGFIRRLSCPAVKWPAVKRWWLSTLDSVYLVAIITPIGNFNLTTRQILMNIPSPKSRRDTVEFALCERRLHVMAPLKTALGQTGYSQFHNARDVDELRLMLAGRPIDLIVADIELPDGDLLKLVKDIRHGRAGRNPFVVIMVTSWAMEADMVRSAIDAGVDDFLVNPISPQGLADRIRNIVEARKPFIVTSDYIGPERRRDPKRSSDIPYFNPPNTLREKELGNLDALANVEAEIERSAIEMREERLRRIGFQISFLVDLVTPKLVDPPFDDQTVRHLRGLETAAREAVEKLKGTKFEAIATLCKSMLGLAKRINADPANLATKDRELLSPLSIAILEAFYPGRDGGDLMNEIASAVSNFTKRG
jgi:DNA-binding response OmpR family regulator